MARFECTGLDELVADFERLGVALTGEIADKVLLAGAEQVKIAWRNAAEKHGLRDTGSMIDNIGYPRAPKTVNDVRSIDIYPQGRDERGYKNAAKAFVLHYGKPGRKGRGWIDDADRECDSTVIPAMKAAFETELKKRGM